MLFELADFFDAPLVAAAFECGVHPDFDQPLGAAGTEHVAREAENVEVVVAAAEFGGDFVCTGGGTHAGKFVGANCHADAGAANQDAAIGFAAANFFGDQGCEIGVVDAGVARRAFVEDFVAFRFQQRDHAFLEVIPAMITGDGDFHSVAEYKFIGSDNQILAKLLGMVLYTSGELGGAVAVRAYGLTDGIGDVGAFGHQQSRAGCGFRPALDDRLQMTLRHGEDQIRMANELFRERLGFVTREVEALLAHDLHGFGGGGATGGGGEAGGHDDDAVGVEFVHRAAEAFGEAFAHEDFGHGAAAGVASADEEHHDAGQAAERGFADDAFAEDFEGVLFDADDGGWLAVAAWAIVEDHGDVAIEILQHFLGGRRVWLTAAVGARQHDGAGEHSQDGLRH